MKKKKETFAKVVTGHLTQEKAGERLSESFLTIKYGDHSRASRKRVLWYSLSESTAKEAKSSEYWQKAIRNSAISNRKNAKPIPYNKEIIKITPY